MQTRAAEPVHLAGGGAPRVPEVGILAFVPERWGGVWMPRHQVCTRLARWFPVVWVNPAPEWRQALNRPPAATDGAVPRGCAGFRVYEPEPWLPRMHRPAFVSALTARARIARARRLLSSCSSTVFYIWRPAFAEVLDLARADLSVYHIDDEYSFSDVEAPLDEREARLIRRVDQVIIHSPALLQKKGGLNPHTTFVPNGVDYRAYSRPCAEPRDLGQVPHPRIGYVGVIKKHLDFRLLISLAERHRGWNFVLIGPQGYLGEAEPLFRQLLLMENVRWLGPRPVEELPAYTQHLDVCLMCYLVNDYTRYIFPLKLHEYLASGRPAVGSPIRTLQDFAHLVPLCGTLDQWSRAIQESLEPERSSPERVEERRRTARRYDWETLVGSIARKICERLGRPAGSER